MLHRIDADARLHTGFTVTDVLIRRAWQDVETAWANLRAPEHWNNPETYSVMRARYREAMRRYRVAIGELEPEQEEGPTDFDLEKMTVGRWSE